MADRDLLIGEIKSGSSQDPPDWPRTPPGKGPAISKHSHPRRGIAQLRSSQDQIRISL